MKNWIRLIVEILLGAAVVGSGTFIYLQMTEISELRETSGQAQYEFCKTPPSDSTLALSV